MGLINEISHLTNKSSSNFISDLLKLHENDIEENKPKNENKLKENEEQKPIPHRYIKISKSRKIDPNCINNLLKLH